MKPMLVAAVMFLAVLVAPLPLRAEPAPAMDAIRTQADKLYRQGKYAESLALYRLMSAHFERTAGPEAEATADSLIGVARALGRLDRHADALPLYERALKITEQVLGAEDNKTAIRLVDLGSQYETLDRHADALPLYQRALKIAEQVYGAEHSETSSRLNRLARLHGDMGRHAEALPLLERALRIDEKAYGSGHLATVGSLNALASLYWKFGRYADAMQLQERALRITEDVRGPEHGATAVSLNDLGVLYHSLGRYDDALRLAERALRIDEQNLGPQHSETAILVKLYNLASVNRDLGRYADALSLNERARRIAEKAFGHEHSKTAGSYYQLARVYRAMGRPGDALPLAERALRINEQALGPDHSEVAYDLHNLAEAYRAMDRFDEALPLYRRAYRISLGAGVPEVAFRVRRDLALAYHAASRPELAIFFGKQAVNTMQRTRSQSKALDKGSQKALLTKNEGIYKSLSGWLIAAGRIPEAQQVLAMLKEDEYFEFVSRDSEADANGTRASLVGREADWDVRLQEAGGRLAALGRDAAALRKKAESARSPSEKARLKELDAALDAAGADFARELDALQAAFDQVQDKQRYAELKGKALERDLTDVVGSLGKQVALLQTIVMDDGVHLILTTPEVRLARKANIARADLNRQIDALLGVLRTPQQDPKPAAQALYRTLMAPVEADLRAAGTRTLMLSLDDVLRYVPLASLHDGAQYLVERYALALFTDVARENLKDAPKAQWRIAGLGLTESREGFKPLPSVRNELEGLVRAKGKTGGVLPGMVKLDDEFTRDGMRSALKEKFPVLHIASHFKFDPRGDRDSFLLMGDGKLSLEEVRKGSPERKQGPYSFAGVDLLTLSACQTAVGGGKDANGREIEGFGVLAQTLGAKAVIATLWPVADRSTSLFMRQLYQLRQEKKLSKAEALRQAQLALLTGAAQGAGKGGADSNRGVDVVATSTGSAVAPKTPFAHPFYWAPFILMGNWL